MVVVVAAKFPYLEATLMEVQRLANAVPLPIRRPLVREIVVDLAQSNF